MAAGLFMISQKFYKIDYEYAKILKIFLIMGITATIYYVYMDDMNIVGKIIVFAGFLFSFIVLKIVKKDELLRTVKSFGKGANKKH
jgi:hypothetical protein